MDAPAAWLTTEQMGLTALLLNPTKRSSTGRC